MPPPTTPAGLFSITPRDITGDLANAGTTLSSWDSCMAEAYCKWPVIAAIIVGSLIILSIIFCCARCLCCGLECCCGICSCCNRCCPSPRGTKDSKYEPAPRYPHPQYPAYPPHNPMNYPPQFATFDASSKPKNVHEDSLPEMPSWQSAQKKVVEDTSPPPHTPATPNDDPYGKEAIAMGAINTPNPNQDNRVPYDQERQPMLSPVSEQGQGQGYPYQSAAGFVGGDLSQPQNDERSYNSRSPYQRGPTTSPPPAPFSNNPYNGSGYGAGIDNAYTRAPSARPYTPSSVYTAAPSYHTRAPTSPADAYGSNSLNAMPDGFAGYAPRRSESTRYEPSSAGGAQRGFYPTDTKPHIRTPSPSRYQAPREGAAELWSGSRDEDERSPASPHGGQHHAASELFYPSAPTGAGRKPVGGSWT